MKLKELKSKLEYPIFSSSQIEKLFTGEESSSINVQLSRWEQKGELVRLKRGIYKLAGREVDEMVVAGILYKPSYISLELALHYQGIIPGVVSTVTSVTTITSREFKNQMGVFSYSKIRPKLYFGFNKVQDSKSKMYYQIAEPEKALLDWIYLRKIKDLEANRVEVDNLDRDKLAEWGQEYPDWVRKVVKTS